jgi:spore coat protein CotF
MKEKEMVADYLSTLNSSIKDYAGIITQADNPQLRQTLQQMRNGDEQKQYEVYQAAVQRNYYTPASQASQHDIQQVKQQFMQGNQMNPMNQQMNQTMMNQNQNQLQ